MEQARVMDAFRDLSRIISGPRGTGPMSTPTRPAPLAVFAVLLLAAASPAEKPADLDARVTLRARRALAKDRLLKELNLGVRVHYGVATLWGPVPSAELAARAVRLVGKVEGVHQVRDELFAPPALPGDVLAKRE